MTEEGRNKSVVEEVYRLMGQPVPDKLQRELNGENPMYLEEVEEPELDELEEVEENEPEEEEPEDEEHYGIDYLNAVPNGCAETLGNIVTNMNVLGEPELNVQYVENGAEKNTRINQKKYIMDIIRRTDEFIGHCLYQLATMMVTKHQQGNNSPNPAETAFWGMIVGYDVTDRGEIGLILDSNSLQNCAISRRLNVLVRRDAFDDGLNRFPYADQMDILLRHMDAVMKPARQVIRDDLITLDPDITKEIWSKSEEPKYLLTSENVDGCWTLDRDHLLNGAEIEDDHGNLLVDEFRLNKKTFWLRKASANLPLIELKIDQLEDTILVESLS